MVTLPVTQHGLRPPQVGTALASQEMGRRAIYHGWLVPVIKQPKLTIYDAGDVAAVWQRIRNGEIPPPIPRKKKIGGGA